MTITQKIGIILANLGTPDAPQPAAISRYLADFFNGILAWWIYLVGNGIPF